MSRSRRKTPILAMTSAGSEKDDKRLAARGESIRLTSQLRPHTAADEGFDLPEHRLHRRGGQWIFSKDGKHYLEIGHSAELKKLLRKYTPCSPYSGYCSIASPAGFITRDWHAHATAALRPPHLHILAILRPIHSRQHSQHG